MKTVVKENANGGKGQVVVKHILDDNELNAKCKMFAEVTIAPGCSLGYHEHTARARHIISSRDRASTMTMERNVRLPSVIRPSRRMAVVMALPIPGMKIWSLWH